MAVNGIVKLTGWFFEENTFLEHIEEVREK
jgi:hypothetical protein